MESNEIYIIVFSFNYALQRFAFLNYALIMKCSVIYLRVSWSFFSAQCLLWFPDYFLPLTATFFSIEFVYVKFLVFVHLKFLVFMYLKFLVFMYLKFLVFMVGCGISFWFLILSNFQVGLNLLMHNSSVIRLKGESQNRRVRIRG